MVRGFQQVMGAPYEDPPLLPDEAAWVRELERTGFRAMKSKRSARAVRTVLSSPDGATVAVVSSSTSVCGNRVIEVALSSPFRTEKACTLVTRFADPPLKLREEELVQAFPASTADELLRHHDATSAVPTAK
jgi:hypothetical protein